MRGRASSVQDLPQPVLLPPPSLMLQSHLPKLMQSKHACISRGVKTHSISGNYVSDVFKAKHE